MQISLVIFILFPLVFLEPCIIFAKTPNPNSSPNFKKKNSNQELNFSPIIAILTQPSPYIEFPKENYSHIQSSYIKGIEAAGGRVIPIRYDDSREKIKEILKYANGVFLPGGGTNLRERNETTGKRQYSKYGKIASYIFSYVKNENKKGKYYPFWGTCLGFELMMMTYSGKKKPIKKVYGMVNHLDRLVFINVI